MSTILFVLTLWPVREVWHQNTGNLACLRRQAKLGSVWGSRALLSWVWDRPQGSRPSSPSTSLLSSPWRQTCYPAWRERPLKTWCPCASACGGLQVWNPCSLLETWQLTLLERNRLVLQPELEAKDERHLLISPEKHKKMPMYQGPTDHFAPGQIHQATNAARLKLALNVALFSVTFSRRGKDCTKATVPVPGCVLIISEFTASFFCSCLLKSLYDSYMLIFK